MNFCGRRAILLHTGGIGILRAPFLLDEQIRSHTRKGSALPKDSTHWETGIRGIRELRHSS